MNNLRSWTIPQLALVLAGVALLGGSAAVAAADLRPHSSAQASAAKGRVPAVKPAPDQYSPPTPRPDQPQPQRISIPSIGVDAAVEPVSVNDKLEMATPTSTPDVGWYSIGSSPGQPGDAVFDGHLDTQTGAPAVFARLSQVKPGDPVMVTLPAGVASFRVATVSSVPYHSVPPGLYATDGPARLTLITCSGTWDPNQGVYSQRLVVEAVPQ